MNLWVWLVIGACCLAVGWWVMRQVRHTDHSVRRDRAAVEVERQAEEERAARDAAAREASRQHLQTRRAARAEVKRQAEAQASPPIDTPDRTAPPVAAPALASAPAQEPEPVADIDLPVPPSHPVAVPQALLPEPATPALLPVLPPAQVAEPLRPSPARPVILIADDSKVVRVKTGRILAQQPYEVCFASDGLEALQAIQANAPNVLITDVDMPGLDGFELTRRVRAEPATAGLPVIMITAADETHRAAAAQAGVDVVLGKPFSDADLIRHVEAAVQRRETMASVAPQAQPAQSAAQAHDQAQTA